MKPLLPYLIVLTASLSFSSVTSAQVHPVPPIREFSKEVYGASSQNWSVTQSTDGNVYVANTQGLLEFDGVTWSLYPSPGGNIIRAVHACSDGRIYTSGYMELGYWERDPYGRLYYTSLTGKAREHFTPNVEFWNILSDGQRILFQAFTLILVYENDSIKPIPLRQFTNSLFLTGGKMLANVMNDGIYELKGEERVPWLTGEFFRGKLIRFVSPTGDGSYLLGTASHGIFKTDGRTISEWETPENDYFKKNQINKVCQLPDGELLVGTILDGVTLIDSTGKLIWRINNGNGLLNNTVLGLFLDRDKNIWVALDRGINLIAWSTSTGLSIVPVEGVGAIYSAAVTDGLMYLGTNQGLYVSSQSAGRGKFELVSGTQGQVWDLKRVGRWLVAGHNNGTFSVTGTRAVNISGVSGGFSLISDPFEAGSFLQCSYSNLVKYRLTSNGLTQNKIIYNFNELIRFIEFDHLGNLWGSHMHKGLFRLRLNEARDSVILMKRYDNHPAFTSAERINLFKMENRIIFATGDSLFTYSDLQDTIVSAISLNRNLGRYARAIRIIPAGDHLYWMFTRESLGLLRIDDLNVKIIRQYPNGLFDNQLIRDYENVVQVNDSLAIVCLENGIAWVDTRAEPRRIVITDRIPAVRTMTLIDPKGKHFAEKIGLSSIRIPYNRNSLRLRFSLPHFSGEMLGFHWLLEGLTTHWSAASRSPVMSFDRLPVGKYTLRVKAADMWGNESKTFTMEVIVAPPWYASVWAKIFYLFLIIGMLMIFRSMIIRKTREKEKRDREEKEKELITLKNEKLQAEISFKSKELANSTMAIIKKNEFLLDLKETLLQQKNQLGTRFPDKYYADLMKKIEENLSGQDDWKIFDNNFEQAHETFIKNLTLKFNDLTPGDIRLCAFLRMNLSSKEIAPLLGISIRGVENHRYRLRKKMGLDHDDNLIEMILKM